MCYYTWYLDSNRCTLLYWSKMFFKIIILNNSRLLRHWDTGRAGMRGRNAVNLKLMHGILKYKKKLKNIMKAQSGWDETCYIPSPCKIEARGVRV